MKSFEYPVTILEHHIDSLGHVNNATYVKLYEEARWDFCHQAGFGMDWVMREEKGFVVLGLDLKFKKEIRLREKITIHSQMGKVSRNLIVTCQQKMLSETGETSSTLNLTFGLMDLKTRKLLNVPKEWGDFFGLELKGQ